MGQYHTMACPEAGTYVSARNVGSFVKAIEQLGSFGPSACLAYLCAGDLGDKPGDLPWAAKHPLTPRGLWAGRTPLMIGDYAEPGDLMGRDDIFTAGDETTLYNSRNDGVAKRYGSHKPVPRKSMNDLAPSLICVLERAFNARMQGADTNGVTKNFGQFVEVTKSSRTPQGWEIDYSGLEGEELQDLKGYYQRSGIADATDILRGPLPIGEDFDAPDAISDDPEDHGTPLLWVNLDRGEFIDPAAMGERADLVGVMKGDASKAVQAFLFHGERRGGGDLGPCGPFSPQGRWRGDRIVLMGEAGWKKRGQPHIDQEMVRRDFTDVTQIARGFIKPKDIFKTEEFSANGMRQLLDRMPTGKIMEMVQIALQAPAFREIMGGETAELLKKITVTAIPPTIMTHDADGKKLAEPYKTPGSFFLEIGPNDSKVWMPREIHARIQAIVDTLPVAYPTLGEKTTYSTVIDESYIESYSLNSASSHAVIGLMSDLQADADTEAQAAFA